jgi:hypothetical protein
MKTLSAVMKIKLISLVLFGLLFVSGCIAEEPLVLVDGPLKIERIEATKGYQINFFKNDVLVGSFYRTPNEQDPAGYVLEIISSNIKIIFPLHFSKDGKLLTLIKSPTLTRSIEFGELAQITPNIVLTKFGNINILGHILTPAGYAFLNLRDPKDNTKRITYLINPRDGNSISQPSSKLLLRITEAVSFLTKTHLFPYNSNHKIMTNTESNMTLEDGIIEGRSANNNCEEVPACCCKPEEMAEDGKCYLPTLLVAGAFGDTSGFEGILDKIDEHPCMKNTKFFGYNPDITLPQLAKDIAEEIKNFSNACKGSPVAGHGYCHGGRGLEQAMDLLAEDGKPKLSITTYNTAYEGTHRIYPFLNTLSLGIAGLFLAPTIRDYMKNNLPPPNQIPPNVTSFTAHVAGNDHDFSEESQKAGPEGADYYVDEEGTHYNTLERNFKYISCCGDGAVQPENGEECEGEGSQCNATGLCYGLPLIGTCDDKCKCDTSSYTCSDVSTEPSPSPSLAPLE